jgi:MoxR-like ATPase
VPCALEGDTAVAKTTAVLWVAHLCRQEAVRLNLNGQSDTGELVGRFVPAVGEAGTAWRFWEGIIPDAMRHGRWVVLDELNLAEPQVLERLNPVLEQPPSLVLSEHTGERFGPEGDVPVADSFRIFATMNPAEYAGRSVLSPAFRDRWNLWNVLKVPAEAEYRALLARLVHGVQPEFVLDGVEWHAADGESLYPQLATDDSIDSLLDAFASFHGAISAAAGESQGVELGRSRRERYVFTRRTMLAAMALWADLVNQGREVAAACLEALELVYLQRVQPGPDRAAVRTALRTAGLDR